MTANNSKSYLPYLNKLVDQYSDTYHHSFDENPFNADYSASTENFDSNPKAPKLKVNDRVRITKYKNIISKDYTENWSREIFIIDSVLKTNPWTYKIKNSNVKKIIGSFYENELLQSILQMSYFPKPDSHIRDKVKVILDLSNYATKKELDHARRADTSDLAAKKDFIALKSEIDKLDINKLVNVPTSLSNLKTKVDDLDVGILKTVPIDLKELSDVVDNDVIKNTTFNTLKTKVNTLEKNSHKSTEQKKLERKIGDVDTIIPDTSGLVTTTVLNTKVNEVENKIPNLDKYITTPVFNPLTAEFL